jgi:dynein heavy chain 2, cytosolic
MDYPDTKELSAIYGSYMTAAFGPGSAQAGMRMIADERFRGSVALTKVASTMVEIHQAVLSKYSVDEHRHYMFTPRDLTSWVKGMMRYALDEEPLLEVLAYEAMRIYRDRLVDSDSAAKFDSAVSAALRSQWGFNPDLRDVLFTSLTHVTRAGGNAPASARDGHASGAAVAADASLGNTLHRVTFANLRSLVERGMKVYEREERELGIHLFNEVVEHVACIDRIVTASGGCALLVGRSGVGRRSAASLVAHMRGMTLFSPSVGRGYGVKTFFQDLKTVLATAGVQGEDIVLYLEDHHFTDDEVLESVNSLLASGEIPGLYTHEELEPLLSPLKELMSESVETYRTAYDFFLHRIRKHLHVVIGMDSTHPDFLPRCERNPALYTRCTMVWMGTWKKTSLVESVPALLQDSLEGMAAFVPKELLVDLAVAVHSQATISNPRGAAPRDLVALLRCFRGVYESKVGGSKTEVVRLRAGLTKLEEAQAAVDTMSKQAGAQREELKLKQAAADRAMTDITDALSLASDRKKEVEVLSDRLAVAEGETRARKGAVEAELAGVMPMIEAAKAAVGGIKKEHLDEIRNLRAPPDAVADVLSAVLTLLGINDTSWASMKKFLGERGVKDNIIGFDARKMAPKQRSAVNKILKEKGNSFEKEVITRASFAAAPMAEWVKAVLSYADTLEKIAPLEGELQAATRALEESQAALNQNKKELDEIDVRVRSLRDDFGQRTAEAEVLKAALAKTEDTLHRAQSLLGELSGERDRWSGRVEELSRNAASLPVFALLGAGFITYLGGCSEDVRASSLQEWQRAAGDLLSTYATRVGGGSTKQGLALKAVADVMLSGASGAVGATGKFEPVRFLSTESEVLQWKAQGLPSDDLSVENAAVIINSTHSGRVPFIIDPSTQATAWLQHYLASAESTKGLGSSASSGSLAPASPRKGAAEELAAAAASLEILNAQDPRFQNVVELAVRFGKTLLIKDVDRVEPMLYPLLRRDYYHAGPRSTVQVGDKQVDVNERFRVFFATRNPRPFIPPDAASVITEVNFTVTRSGLESQLLAVTIQHERPELESRKSALLAKEEELKLQLVGVEDSLLQALASSQGNLLEDKALLSSLAQAKAKASEISAALEGSEIATRELDTQRNVYRPFAAAGSTIFFALRDLQGLNNMYQFSLAFFLHLFKTTLSETRPNNNSKAAATPRAQKKQPAYEGKGGDDEDDAAREAAEANAKIAAEQQLEGSAELSSMADLSTLIASAPTPTPEAIAALIHDMEVRVLRSVGTSLLKDDRLMFAMHLVHSMHPAMFSDSAAVAATAAASATLSALDSSGATSMSQGPSQGWRFFLGEVVAAAGGSDGGSDSSGDGKAAMPRGFPLWAARDRASQFKALEIALPDVVRDLALGDTDKWGRWATSSTPEKDFPPHSLKVTSPFHRLLLVHALRPDRALRRLSCPLSTHRLHPCTGLPPSALPLPCLSS